jgi:hypothetical protein
MRFVLPLLLLAACAPADRPAPSLLGHSDRDRAAAPGATASEPPVAESGTPIVMVTDREALAQLEAQGSTFGERLAGVQAANLAELHRTPAWRSLVEVVEQDLAAIRRADRRAGVGMDHAHRLFDRRWLRSSEARFELVGVVNRLDREPFSGGAGCGEVRFVYRLAYATTAGGLPIRSRLPMTVNVVGWQPASCSEAARRWLAPSDLSGAALARWLAAPGGPLDDGRPWRERIKSVEINLQSVRWPSTVHPSMAGHAEYLLRVFHGEGARLVPAALENQPDVERLRASPALRAELIAWIEKSLAGIDEGTAVLPERLSATSARSVAPRGLARLANRPFSQILSTRELKGVDASALRFARTPEELLRRLDGLSCSGCHQSRSLAGFHLLGEDDPEQKVDALGVAMSPHLADELALRMRAFADGSKRPRPLAERVPPAIAGAAGRWGEHCGLEAFSEWSCGEGLRCQPLLGDAEVGACVEEQPAVGGACETGVVTREANPHRDRVGRIEQRACQSGVCERNAVGFPGGMCSARCGAGGDEAICGAIALLVDFNDCLAERRPFAQCITDNSRPAALRRCSQAEPCRDDYVCARAPGGGACMPPYFLFQLRVDGHPL